MILCSKFIEQNKLVRKIQYEWISQPIQLLFTRQLHHDLVLICVQRLATSEHKPARLGKSLLLGLSRRSGQTYPLVADRVASQPLFDGVQQLDIVKFALPLVKISFHPIFSAVGKHENFFEASQAASRPYYYFTFSITSFAATSPVLTGATSA
ncbi:MAG: hypothetical protein PWP69_338 [Enterococcus sp.]|nr:hypothetical protein [Enterococcus sp.]